MKFRWGRGICAGGGGEEEAPRSLGGLRNDRGRRGSCLRALRGEILFARALRKIPLRPPPVAEVLFARGRFPGDQVKKAGSAIRVQKPLRFPNQMERNSEKIEKSGSQTWENKDPTERDPHFRVL